MWQTVGGFVWDHLLTLGTALGLGSGVGVIKFLRHMPPPLKTQIWYGSIFDTFQDLVSNQSRIGERREPDGDIIPPPAVPKTEQDGPK